jgi:spermidine synthase
MIWFFILFFISGFCSILYEIVWLRLAMAQFGVTSALTSIVLSMFMAGLGLGSWGMGRLIRSSETSSKDSSDGSHKTGQEESPGIPDLRFYALAELLIGISALLVPYQLLAGRQLLERLAVSSSSSYYLGSGLCLALILIPWCACMGATIPLAMQAIRKWQAADAARSFSYLYLANVLGAVAGATVPLLLIEVYGFRGTLRVGAICNGVLAASAIILSAVHARSHRDVVSYVPTKKHGFTTSQISTTTTSKPLVVLCLTGLTSMGMEVVWIRQFTPYLGTVVYAFAALLAAYLVSTFLGLQVYRLWSKENRRESRLIWVLLGLFAPLSLVGANPNLHLSWFWRLTLGIVPFSGVLGFVTPLLVDRWSRGDPGRAGKAYAMNVLGCIMGPLLSGFVLLPLISERWILFIFAAPWLVIAIAPRWFSRDARPAFDWQSVASYAVVLLALVLVLTQSSFEDQFVGGQSMKSIVLRDNTATIVATGTNRYRLLLVNGQGITALVPATKLMAHLPLAFLDRPPRDALVVCFGMGTTFRSLLSWNIQVTAVELVPSVPKVFWFFHADGPELLRSSRSNVMIDDGRRYLERSSAQYDVITIDPPPPVEAAGSSLLYSKEFYAIINRRLRPGGILQQWLPYGDAVVKASVARALKESFPYVRVFHSAEDAGLHFLASHQPLPERTPAELARRLGPQAAADLIEWGPESTPELQFASVLRKEISLAQMIAQAPQAPALQDDRPENEYYMLRRNAESRR